jgi:uncharacterized protein (TIGR01777 family)
MNAGNLNAKLVFICIKNTAVKIAITGGTGFIGSNLRLHLESEGHEIMLLTRDSLAKPAAELAAGMEGYTGIINLAGAPVAARWTARYKEEIMRSRVDTTRKLVEVIGLMKDKPEVLVSASAIGIYPGNGVHGESGTAYADSYLAEVCRAWENEAGKVPEGLRLVIIRISLVLHASGGALGRLLPLFRAGLGGKIASGKQHYSWIHLSDLQGAVSFLLGNREMKGIFNMSSPEVTDNSGFTKKLASVLGKPALFKVPAFALKLVFGQGAATLIEGQAAIPERLLKAGYKFNFPELQSALRDIVSKR